MSCIAQASDRYKTGCFELLGMVHYSTSVANISEEKGNEVEKSYSGKMGNVFGVGGPGKF